MIRFTVYGNAIGMPRARVFVDRHSGHIRAANPAKATRWKDFVALQALPHQPEALLDGPLEVSAICYLQRPASKPKKHKWPMWKPDHENIEKAIWDALEGIIYTNDSRICRKFFEKRYGDPPRVEITIKEIEEAVESPPGNPRGCAGGEAEVKEIEEDNARMP